MKRLLIGAAICCTLTATVTSCKKQTIEERTEVQEGSDIRRGQVPPNNDEGKVGDYYINETTYEIYGPKTAQGWGVAVKFGSAHNESSKIRSGAGAPSPNEGYEGDWYIDLENKVLYGPKTSNQWGTGISLGKNTNNGTNQTPDNELPNYRLSSDRTILLYWSNPKTQVLDMNQIAELANVETIAEGAFARKRALKKVTIGNNVTKFEGAVFEGDLYLEEIVFGTQGKLRAIDVDAFARCYSLKKVTLPNGLQQLGYNAFAECIGLKEVTVPSSCEAILGLAFEKCTALTQVTLNEGLQQIQEGVFKGCTALQKVVFPASLTLMGDNPFEDSSVTEITFKGDVPQMNGQFIPVNITKIYVLPAYLNNYKNSPHFAEIKDMIEPLN